MLPEKIVVTGGSGFIGSCLVNALLEQGQEVMVVDNYSTGSRQFLSDHPRLTIVDGDITRPDYWQTALRDFAPEYVFHLAAIHFIPYCNAHPAEALSVNVTGLQYVLDCCSAVKGVIAASSASVYAISDDPHIETELLGPTDIYGLSKKASEEVLELWSSRTGISSVAARFSNVYGPNETNPHLIPEVMHQAGTRSEIQLGNIDTKRDYIFVGDIVAGLICLKEHLGRGPKYDAYNVSTGMEYSAREVVALLGAAIRKPLQALSLPERFRPSDQMHLCLDNTKLCALGWEPALSVQSGLRVTWEDLQRTGFLKPYDIPKPKE